ncbi:Oxoglutarate/iron-dependent dioxygenase [Macleaya cordata]|uniref:Oxoglutarate/iron-dependent dioxygenase n=1 Tax=Macleaya cordata TaxID=56857 RepID=A0A200QEV0_MACCD|nr:Oxoglutarate/iron-dependent dioxygenase [Macleaya cordata]
MSSKTSIIPTIDLSHFYNEGDDHQDAKKKTKEIIHQACTEYGFFQIVNHGVPLGLMSQALELSKAFFEYPEEEKRKSSPASGAPLPAGYSRQPEHSADKNEYLLMFPPGSSFNVYPSNLSGFREILEETFSHLTKTGLLVEKILNDCLGLPPNFLHEYNHDRSWDFMVALRYFPATNTENTGISEHQDGNCITFVFQDEVGGLEVLKDGIWIPVIPTEGSLIVNLGDVIQVLSNNKYKSATHRVVRQQGGRNRHSFPIVWLPKMNFVSTNSTRFVITSDGEEESPLFVELGLLVMEIVQILFKSHLVSLMRGSFRFSQFIDVKEPNTEKEEQ